ncbi:MAG TPA: hypothetical protein VG675_07140 [Bryobacteraceae bacterium]|nr:hypothetical protein [Bryobacteraceae bacterium]
MKRIIISLGLLTLLCAILPAADLSGKWKGQFDGGGNARELTFDLTANGNAVSGTVSGLTDKSLEIKDGKLDGDTVTFWVMSEYNGEPVKLVYKGQVGSDEIKFHMGTEDDSWGTDLVAKRSS